MVKNKIIERKKAALSELASLLEDRDSGLINYNHYYTDNVQKMRSLRLTNQLKEKMPEDDGSRWYDVKKHLTATISGTKPDMEAFSCDEALDCIKAIYKVCQ